MGSQGIVRFIYVKCLFVCVRVCVNLCYRIKTKLKVSFLEDETCDCVTVLVLTLLFSGNLLCFLVFIMFSGFVMFLDLFLVMFFPLSLISLKSPVFCFTAARHHQSPPHSI